jgi:hypothetical protein
LLSFALLCSLFLSLPSAPHQSAKLDTSSAARQQVATKLASVQAELSKALKYNQRIVTEEGKLDLIEQQSGLSSELQKLKNLVMSLTQERVY